MFDVGRMCVKLAGRDASKKCVIVDVIDDNFVLIDGEVRRRKCNINHLQPLNKIIKVDKKASHEKVTIAFKELGIEARNTKPKSAKPKPVKQRKSAQKGAKKVETPSMKKTEKKTAKPKKEETKKSTSKKE